MHGLRQRGFSLLELLVTLLIIVLATALVTLNIGSGDSDTRLQTAVRQLADGAGFALDEAQFAGADYGLALQGGQQRGVARYSWHWRQRGPEGWRAPQGEREIFRSGSLPEGVELQLEIEEVIQPQETLLAEGEDLIPQVVFYASGETQPGAIELRSVNGGELLWRIEWEMLGNFRALPRGLPVVEEP